MGNGKAWQALFCACALAALLASVASCKGVSSDEPAGSTPTSLTIDPKLTIESSPVGDGGPASPSLGSFAVYATESLAMNSGALITGGNAGVEGTSGPFLGGGAAASFNSGATIASSETLYAYSVSLNSGVSLGPVDTNKVTGNTRGATYGPVSAFPAMPSPPPTPAATAGTTSITLNSNQSKTIAAGAYGSVTVNSGATLSLTGGHYVFSSLTLNSNATMSTSAPATVSVTGSGSFNSGSFAGPTLSSGLTAKSLVLYFDSSNGISLNSGAKLQALLVATSAEVTVNTSGFTGAIAAAEVLMNSNATVTFQDGFGSLVSGADAGVNLCAGVVCAASDACHVAGTCDPSTGVCSNPSAPNGTACNDGNACTTVDTCESGTCVGSSPVVCTASGPCSVAGTCDPSTGACSNPSAPNGTACNDGNACTTVDTCESGTCVGSSPVVCTASGPCSVAGTCDPSTGACSNPSAPNGTACNDGNACTTVDTCESGTCVGSSPVVCTASGPCSVAGTCDPSTGVCSNPSAPNGTACNDGNACTTVDTCESGTCVGSSPVVCTASGPCSVAGTCDPSTGVCSNPSAPNGTACNDGNACSTGDSCQGGTCVGGAPVVCRALDSCHVAGTCTNGDGGTGGCSNPVAAAGTSCEVGQCGGTCNAAGACVQTVAAQNACFTTSCVPDAGVVTSANACVPTLNGTVATNVASMVAGGSVNAVTAAIVRGRVLGLPDATPLAGATVSILGHPEYTPSITGADGTYAVAVNAGAQITVVFNGPAGGATYLSVQRHTPTRWQDYAVIPDVYLTPLDPHATDIAQSNGTWESAAGSTITDPADEGGPSPTLPHTARLFFPAGTTASFEYGGCGSMPGSCGATCSQGTCTGGLCLGAAPPQLTVRLTEYTVGSTGPAAMPAELPPATGYTYAVELSSDEALAAGATGVAFNQPVSFYVEDFIGFGPAQASLVNPPVPVGYYNRQTGTWVPSANGAIVDITGFTGSCPGDGCVAVVSQPAADAGTTVALTSDELAFLGQTYGGTATPLYLWRFQTTHFTGFDTNWHDTPPPGAEPPPGIAVGGPPLPSPLPVDPECPSDQCNASIIATQNSVLAEEVSIPGTPYFLRYESMSGASGFPTLQIPITGPAWPPPTLPLSVTVQITVAGNVYLLDFPPASLAPNYTAAWTWDEEDAFGNRVEGEQNATVTVNYTYKSVYVAPSLGDVYMDFDSFTNGVIIEAHPVRNAATIPFTATSVVPIGLQAMTPTGLGGWTVSAQHVYDPHEHLLSRGDGIKQVVKPGATTLQVVPGTPHFEGMAPAFMPDGTIYTGYGSFLDVLTPSGTLTTIIGEGTVLAPYPPCTSYANVRLPGEVEGVATTPSGLVYVANAGLIHLVDPAHGTIQTVAGTYANGNPVSGCTDAPVATQGTLSTPNIALAPDGTLYFGDQSCNTLRKLGLDGSLQTLSTPFAQCEGKAYALTNGQLVGDTCFSVIRATAAGPDGSIFVADEGAFPRVVRVDPRSGAVSLYAGAAQTTAYLPTPQENDGLAATLAVFSASPTGLAVDPAGTVYLSDYNTGAIYSIDSTGLIHLIAGGDPAWQPESFMPPSTLQEEDNVPAVGGLIAQPTQIAVNPNGSILFVDYGVNATPARLRSIAPAYPSFGAGTSTVPSKDGTELYVFETYGQHVATLDPVTGATLRTFQYDAQSRLTSIVETRGGTTTFAYDGTTVTITPPFSEGGQQTVMTLDQAGGHAIALTTPAGEQTQLAYDNDLMTSLVDPRGGLHSYTYDTAGRLLTDTDPTKATIGLLMNIDTTPTPVGGGALPLVSWTTVETSAAGHVTQRQDLTLSNASRQRNVIAPSGATTLSTETSSELWTMVAADGTTTTTQQAPDPQFGMLDPYPGTVTKKTPAGLTYSSVRTRTSTGSALAPTTITDRTTLNGQSAPWSSVFTAATKEWLFTSPAGRQRAQTLDSLGRVSSISYPGASSLPTTSFVYDSDGRVSSITLTPGANGGGAARVTTNTYDTYLAGYLASVQDPQGDVTTYDQRDQDGRVLDVELPDFASSPKSHVATTYDPNGNITSVTVPPATTLPSTHTFTNTPVDLLESYTPPQVSTSTTGDDPELATLATAYTYNPDRQVTAIDTPEGTSYDVIGKTYDTYGRLAATYDPLSNVTASYQYVLNAAGVSTDQVGSITTSDGVAVSNSFDGFLKKKTSWASSSVTGSVNWTYDSFFRPSTLQVSGAPAITFAYDLDSLYVGTSSPVFTVTRDESGSSLDGLPYASTLGTVSDAWTYDGFGAQSSYTVKTSDGTVLYAMYGSGGIGSPIARDSLGRITVMNETINGATHSWLMTYDVRGRLESVTLDGNTSVYGYDPNGNLTTINGSTFGTYDAQDRLVTLTPPNGSGPWSFSYTNNGDLTFKTNGSQDYVFDYDLSSNLRSVQVNATSTASVNYTIDGLNHRIARSIAPSIGSTVADGLLYDEQGRVVAELDASNNVLSTFVYGLKPNVPDYMVRGGTVYRIVSDWRGDVRLVLDTTKTGAAAVVQQVDYDAWGNVLDLTDPGCSVGGTALCFQPFGFAGGVWEPSTGVVRFGARDYDAQAGRFVQKDPIRFMGGQSNIYAYVNDDPINGADPTGTISQACYQSIVEGCQQGCGGCATSGLCVATCVALAVLDEQFGSGGYCPNESGTFELCELIYEDASTCNYICSTDESLVDIPKTIPFPGQPAQTCAPIYYRRVN